MIQAFFGGILFEYIGLFTRWLVLYVIDSFNGKKPKNFRLIKNKYKDLSADSVAYDFGNKIYGMAFTLTIVLIILKLESCN